MQVERCFRGAGRKKIGSFRYELSVHYMVIVFRLSIFFENKVAHGCVTRGNLPNSSGGQERTANPGIRKAFKRCLMSLRSIR